MSRKSWIPDSLYHYQPSTFAAVESTDRLGIHILVKCKRIRDAAFFLIIMLFTFAATLLKSQNYVSSRTIQKCVEHVSTSTEP